MNKKIYPIPDPQPLSEEEKKENYAYLYDMPLNDPDDEVLHAISPGNLLSQNDMLPLKDFEKFFTKDAYQIKNGYGLFEDGTGFYIVTSNFHMTPEHYNRSGVSKFINTNDLTYKIWFPGLHIKNDPPKIIREDLGWGPIDITITKGTCKPLDYLSNEPKVLDERTIKTGLCCCTDMRLLSNPEDNVICTLFHRTLKDGNGCLIKQHISWIGQVLVDGKVINVLKPGEKADIERVRLFACHMAFEDKRVADLANQLIKDQLL